MKTILTFMLLALALTGCANTDYAQYSKAQTDMATARHSADAERYKAFAAIAASGDSTAKVAAVIAMAVSMAPGSGVQNAIQAPQASQALQWASILVPGLTQVAGMRYSFMSQQTASNNATTLGISTNATMAGIAGRIQAPGAITTLSGTGNLGSGTYGTADRHDVLNTSPVITPVVQVVPTVIEPVVQVVPTVINPVVQVVPVVK